MDRQLSAYLNGREPQVATDIDVITAAVAVPLLEIDGEDHVLFTVRSQTLVDSLVKLAFLVDIVKAPIKLELLRLFVNARKN